MIRRLLAIGTPIGVLAAAGIGFMPRIVARNQLDQYARDAGLAALRFPGHALAAARSAVKEHPGVVLVYFNERTTPSGLPSATVTVNEIVHTFVSDLPAVRQWFRISSTQTSIG